MTFDVVDMETAVSTALSYGAYLDGPMKYPTHGKVTEMYFHIIAPTLDPPYVYIVADSISVFLTTVCFTEDS
jgi:hypothetical protein